MSSFVCGALTATTICIIVWIMSSSLNKPEINEEHEEASLISKINQMEKNYVSLNNRIMIFNAKHNFTNKILVDDVNYTFLEYPCLLNKESIKCEEIHVAFVVAGYNACRSFVTVIKSILFYRKNPLHFHILSNSVSRHILSTLFDTWNIPQLSYTLYEIETITSYVDWIPNSHYSGVYGLLKLVLPKLLPKKVEKLIVLDTDITFNSNIAELWAIFSMFKKYQVIGLVENQSDWYLGTLKDNPWPALDRGFNTGVMLYYLKRMRQLNWDEIWPKVTKKKLQTLIKVDLADQDIINAVFTHYPKIVRNIPCVWNVQLSHNTRNELCYKQIPDLKIIHWNSPEKYLTKTKHGGYFRNMASKFVEYDGKLLKTELFECDVIQSSSEKDEQNNTVNKDNVCNDFKLPDEISFRIHLYYLEYEYDGEDDPSDVTLVAQSSFDRVQMLEMLCKYWKGPMSLALYLTDAEAQRLLEYVSSSEILKERKDVAYHIVYKESDVYPVNFLRNVALKQVSTPYVFLSDVDFLPPSFLYNYLKESIMDVGLNNGKKALVVPAFETERYRPNIPNTKAEIINMLDKGELFTFRYRVWPQGHSPTDYSKWKHSVVPYEVTWKMNYEPYVVVSKEIPAYDNRFIGFGWNKVSHIMELNAHGYIFHVLPNAFIIHLPHSTSIDVEKFRTSRSYRKCLKFLKGEFIKSLIARYPSQRNVIVDDDD